MGIKMWDKVGKMRVLQYSWKKSMVSQSFKDPESGEVVERELFRSTVTACMILPITDENRVIAIKQFRFGVNKAVLELPAGGIDPKETPSDAGNRELREESGYRAKEIIQLVSNNMIFADPAACNWGYYPLLGLNCFYEGRPKPERYEQIKVLYIHLGEWLEKIYSGEVRSNLAVATTLLALPYLDIDIRKFR